MNRSGKVDVFMFAYGSYYLIWSLPPIGGKLSITFMIIVRGFFIRTDYNDMRNGGCGEVFLLGVVSYYCEVLCERNGV